MVRNSKPVYENNNVGLVLLWVNWNGPVRFMSPFTVVWFSSGDLLICFGSVRFSDWILPWIALISTYLSNVRMIQLKTRRSMITQYFLHVCFPLWFTLRVLYHLVIAFRDALIFWIWILHTILIQVLAKYSTYIFVALDPGGTRGGNWIH